MKILIHFKNFIDGWLQMCKEFNENSILHKKNRSTKKSENNLSLTLTKPLKGE